MDPASAIGLTASLVQLIGTVTKTIGYLNDIKNAPKERTQLSQETLGLLSLLMNLRDKVETADATSPWYARVSLLDQHEGPLHQYKTSLDSLAKLVAPRTGLRSAGKKLVWPLDKKKIHDSMAVVERLKSLIFIALQEDNFTLSEAIKHDVAVLTEDLKTLSTGITQRGIDQMHQEIVRWLSPLNPASKQIDVLSRHQEGTGKWLLSSVQFSKWVLGEERFLWCRGMPGAGKTVLTAIVVDHLQRLLRYQDDTAVLFVYNDYKDQQTQSTANLIGAFLQQIVLRRKDVSNELMALYQKHDGGRTRATVDELRESLCIEIRKMEQVFILVDALDEFCGNSGDRAPLIAQLQELSKERTSRLLITSRHNTSIEWKLPAAVHIEVRASGEDIRSYIESRLLGASPIGFRVKLDDAIRHSIIDTLINNAQGMFLSVELHLNALRRKRNKKDLRKALGTLPKDLNGVYEETFKRISAQDPDDLDLATRVLAWLSYSPRPMIVEELQHALAVEPDTKELDWDNIIEDSVLISVCGGLVTIEDESRVIRLVHFTTQEYITSVRQKICPSARLDLLVSCLTYLQYESFTLGKCEIWKDPEYLSGAECKESLSSYSVSVDWPFRKLEDCQCSGCLQCNALSFRNYASHNWISFARGDLERDLKIASLIMQLLSDKQARKSVMNVYVRLTDQSQYPFEVARRCSSLHVAAFLGLKTIFSMLLDKGCKIDTRDAQGNFALHYAAGVGEDEIVKLALRAGAKLDRQGTWGLTPLMAATLNGHLSTLQTLLENKARTEIESYEGRRALEYAAESSKNAEGTVRLLLEKGATVRNNGKPTLHCAIDTSVAQLLIDEGANIEAVYHGLTPLVYAAIHGRGNAVRFFIEKGANTEPLRRLMAENRLSSAKRALLNSLLEEEIWTLYIKKYETFLPASTGRK